METNIIARRDWNGDAAAFIEFNPENNKVRVYGKFYADEGYRKRGHVGPATDWFEELPASLKAEVQNRGWRDPMSQELRDFCNRIFAEAKELEPWFGY